LNPRCPLQIREGPNLTIACAATFSSPTRWIHSRQDELSVRVSSRRSKPQPQPRPPLAPAGASCSWAAVGADRNPSGCVVIAAGIRCAKACGLTDKLRNMADLVRLTGQIRRESKAETGLIESAVSRTWNRALAAIIRQMSGPVTLGQGSPATPTTLPGSKPALHFRGGICYDCSASHCIRRWGRSFCCGKKGNPL
jgi:hypothetical protein